MIAWLIGIVNLKLVLVIHLLSLVNLIMGYYIFMVSARKEFM